MCQRQQDRNFKSVPYSQFLSPCNSPWKEEEYEARGKNVAIFTANEHDRIMILTCPRILTAQDYS